MDYILSQHEMIKDILTSIAILIGGLWTLWRFVLQREGHAKIQFNVDLKVIGKLNNKYIVEVLAIVENKGLVRRYVNDFKFDLLHLSNKHEIKDGDEKINNQLLFHKLINKRYWIPPDWYRSFIDAGVTQNYTYVTHLPVETKLVLIFAAFKYPALIWFLPFKTFHTAQKTFNVELMFEKLNKTTD